MFRCDFDVMENLEGLEELEVTKHTASAGSERRAVTAKVACSPDRGVKDHAPSPASSVSARLRTQQSTADRGGCPPAALPAAKIRVRARATGRRPPGAAAGAGGKGGGDGIVWLRCAAAVAQRHAACMHARAQRRAL
jgi:hypothetical protein